MPFTRAALLVCFAALGCAGVSADAGQDKGTRWVPLETAPGAAGKKLALIIGIDRFEDDRFVPLRFAERDADAVAAALEGFHRVVRLTGEQTRRPVILAALTELLREAQSPNDTVVVYISSHGSLAQRPGGGLERVLVTQDARMDVLLQTGIRLDDLRALLEHSAARRRLLVLALCHSGKGKSQLPDSLAAALAAQKGPPRLEDVSEATVVLTACAFGETARESDVLSHDVYTHFFLEALTQGDLDGDGAVTATEAHDYARIRTFGFTEGRQRPTAESDVLGVDPIVLHGQRRATGAPVIFSHARSAEGLEVVVDGRPKGALPGSIALEAGAHHLVLVDSASKTPVFDGRVDLAPGEHRNLTDVLPKPLGFEVAVGATNVLPANERFRADVVPALWGVSLGAVMRRLGWQHLVLDGSLTWATNAGTTPGLGLTLNTRVSALSGEFGAGATTGGSRWQLDALVVGGAWWLHRDVSTTGFQATDASLGPTLGARLRLGFRPDWPVTPTLVVTPLAGWVTTGGRAEPHFTLTTSLQLTWRSSP